MAENKEKEIEKTEDSNTSNAPSIFIIVMVLMFFTRWVLIVGLDVVLRIICIIIWMVFILFLMGLVLYEQKRL